ncbi:MAG: hypothetical protein KBG22_08655 [Smithella sp.]|nr:hypothetical protein [Smithella sp.]
MSSIKKDINSTEKLLNVIRGKDEESFHALSQKSNFPPSHNKTNNFKLTFPGIFSSKAKYTVGVDLGEEYICLVKSIRHSEHDYSLIDKKIVKLDSGMSVKSSEFKNILKSSIINFCGNVTECDIWTNISTDHVSVNFLKIPRVPKKQLEKVIFWTAKKDGLIDEENRIFDFEMQGEVLEQGNTKYSVMFYTVLKTEVQRIKSLFADLGIALAGITIVPFAIQNIFRSKLMPATEEIFASLYIGDNSSRIDVYNKENLVMTRGIKTGSGSSMVEAIISCASDKANGIKLDYKEAKGILSTIGAGSEKLKDADRCKYFTKEEIIKMIFPVWERLARQVDLTLKTSLIGNQKIEKLYILSSVNIDQSFLNYMTDQLSTQTEFFDAFKQNNLSSSAASLSLYDRMLISPALGFSLSDNSRTPNAIYTYQEKNKENNSRKIDRIALVAFLAALAICLGTLIYQGSTLSTLKRDKVAAEKELSLYRPLLSREKVQQAVSEVQLKQNIAHQYAQKYLKVVATGDIADLTPQNIRLIRLRISDVNAGTPDDATNQSKINAQQAPRDGVSQVPAVEPDNIIIEGLILGGRDSLESSLTQYVAKLDGSPIFSRVTVKKKEIVKFKKDDVIHFILGVKIG